MQNGKVLATNVNEEKTDPIMQSYCKHEEAIYKHAEVNVLKKFLKRKKQLKKAVIYVVRVLNKDDSLGLSKPCSGCMQAIEAAGLKRVVYSISDNEYGIINLNQT